METRAVAMTIWRNHEVHFKKHCMIIVWIEKKVLAHCYTAVGYIVIKTAQCVQRQKITDN